MISLFGTFRRTARAKDWNDENHENSWKNYVFLNSFGTDSNNSQELPQSPQNPGTKLPPKRAEREFVNMNGTSKGQPCSVLDQNKNVLVRLPNFQDKNIFSAALSDRMSRANLTLEGLPRQPPFQGEHLLSNYRVIKVLGKGTFAKVKLAEHIPTGHKVAIKIIDKSRINEEDMKKMYREIEIMKLLNHPNIITLYEVIEDSKYLNIVMEHAAKGEIYDYIVQKKRLSEDDARSKFGQLLSAIAYCHSKDIVHRDLKVENLLLDGDHNVKVCDFGFGNFFDGTNPLDTFCGSPPYAAPELFRGDKYMGPEVDVWSLGVILFTFLTGNLPFNGKTLSALKSDVMRGNFIVPNFVRVGSEVFLRKFLKVTPEERITLQQAMRESWMTCGHAINSSRIDASTPEDPISTTIIDNMVAMGYYESSIYESVERKLYDHVHATYRIMRACDREKSFYESFGTRAAAAEADVNFFRSDLNLPRELVAPRAPASGHRGSAGHGLNPSTPQPTRRVGSTDYVNDWRHKISGNCKGNVGSGGNKSSSSSNNNNNSNISSNSHHHKGRKSNNREVNKRRRQTTIVREIVGPPSPPEHHEKFLRRYSIGFRPGLISESAKPAAATTITRKNSLSENISSGIILKKENITSNNGKAEPSRSRKSFKEISRNLFRKTKYSEVTAKEEVGVFSRLPSITLKTESNDGQVFTTLDKNKPAPRNNCSSFVTHRLSLNDFNCQIKVQHFSKSLSKNSISYDATNATPVVKHNPTFKEKLLDLIKIKRH